MKYLIISIFILLAALALIFTKFFILNRIYYDEQISFRSRATTLNDEIKKLRQNASYEFAYNYREVADFTVFDRNGVDLRFKDILTPSTIVLRKTEFGCNDCFGQIIDAVKENDSLVRNKLIIIFSVDNSKDVKYFSKQYMLQNMNIYYAAKTNLPDTLERGNLTYLFTMSGDFIIRNFFVPDINNRKCIIDYLNMIKRSGANN